MKVVLAVLLGLLGAITLYAFFIVMNEVYRILEIGASSIPNYITEEKRYKTKLFYAGISVLVGHSIFLLYIFSKPSKVLSRRNPLRRRLLNDQIFLNGNFLYWFAEIGLAFGIFSSCSFDFSELAFFYPLTLLILVVLYFETWKTILRLIYKLKYKFLLLHMALTTGLIFSLASLDVIDQEKVSNALYEYNPSVSIPHASSTNRLYSGYRYNSPFVFLKLKLDDSNELKLYTNDIMKLEYSDLNTYVQHRLEFMREEEIPYLKLRIYADANLELHHIKHVEEAFYKLNILRASYAVYDKQVPFSEYDWSFIYHRITPYLLDDKAKEIPLPPFHEERLQRQFKDSLVISIGKELMVNNTKVSIDMLKEKLVNHIDSTTIIKYQYTKETTYQDYINVLSSHQSVVYKLRKKAQKIHEDSSDYEKFREEQWALKRQFPIHIKEEFKD